MTDKPTQASPKYRAIKNGLGVYIIQELIRSCTRRGWIYDYINIKEFNDRDQAVAALEQLKAEDLKAKIIEKLKNQILDVIL